MLEWLRHGDGSFVIVMVLIFGVIYWLLNTSDPNYDSKPWGEWPG